ncbi:MAG: DNA replication/repair protein RecF [Rhodoglobus sp.]
MFVAHLILTNFRNYDELELSFTPGVTIIVGSNGQGKTNLVESLVYLSTLGSHRVSSDHAMIRQNQNSAIIRAKLRNDEKEILAEVQINRSAANRAQINRSAVKTRELPRYFSSVLFAPEDLALVRGEPSGRRRFIDELLVLRSPRMSAVMLDYERVLRQRNTLLKSLRSTRNGSSTLDFWDKKLVNLGTEIIVARSVLIDELGPQVSNAYTVIAGSDHNPRLSHGLSIFGSTQNDEVTDYSARHHGPLGSTEISAAFYVTLLELRSRELDRGLTLIGPHRDDVIFELNGLPARGYASHGESWSFSLALKLACAAVLRQESTSGDPVLILDDVFAELDESRRTRLASAVSQFEQVLITAAVFDDIPQSLLGSVVRIAAGEVVNNSE